MQQAEQERKKNRVRDMKSRWRWQVKASRLAVCLPLLLGCMVLLAACGGVPADPKHPLSEVTLTPGDTSTPTVTGTVNTHIQPIQVTSDAAGLTSYPGGQMTMTITTSPSANCTFVVSYGKSTPSAGIGITPHSADPHGNVTWTWQVDGNAHTGTWPLTVYATLAGGVKTSKIINVTVTLPSISVVSSQTNLSAYPKNDMVLTIATAPHVQCTLALNFGPSKAVKYLTTSSDSNGIASWTWHIDATAVPGTFSQGITVTLADGETTGSGVNMTIL